MLGHETLDTTEDLFATGWPPEQPCADQVHLELRYLLGLVVSDEDTVSFVDDEVAEESLDRWLPAVIQEFERWLNLTGDDGQVIVVPPDAFRDSLEQGLIIYQSMGFDFHLAAALEHAGVASDQLHVVVELAEDDPASEEFELVGVLRTRTNQVLGRATKRVYGFEDAAEAIETLKTSIRGPGHRIRLPGPRSAARPLLSNIAEKSVKAAVTLCEPVSTQMVSICRGDPTNSESIQRGGFRRVGCPQPAEVGSTFLR
jgi:hypothetical protein